MNPRERGFLLLTGTLGDPGRQPLTVAQFRTLARQAAQMRQPGEDRDLTVEDLAAIGCDAAMARRILALLDQETLLDGYVRRGAAMDCYPITRVSPGYPARLKARLGLDSPGCLWIKGDRNLLETPAVALVGSREPGDANREFAAQVGYQAARQGFTLISGNARGADRIAQESCLNAGGRVISVVADALERCPLCRNTLYIAEDGFDLGFTAKRALSRNRVIHALGQKTFVAQSSHGSGGTWSGTTMNLRGGWSPVFCFDDGSEAAVALEKMGAALIGKQALFALEML